MSCSRARACAPVEYGRARNMIGGGARRMIESGLLSESRRASPDEIDRMFDDFIAHYAAHIADRSRPFPGLEAALDRAGRARLPVRGLHQQARRAVAAAARRAWPEQALCRDLRSGHLRDSEAQSGNPAAHHRGRRRQLPAGRSWWEIPAPISTPHVPPAFRSWRSISATASPRWRGFGPDRLIGHFGELPAAVFELAPSEGH